MAEDGVSAGSGHDLGNENAKSQTSDSEAGRTDIDKRVLKSLRQIIQAVDGYSKVLAKTYQITAPQLAFLKEVVADPTKSIASIGREIHLSSSTLVGIIDRLEKKGWVRRERDTRDRRVVHVVATEAGRQVVASAPGPLHHTLSEGLGKLSLEEQVAIAVSLERVVHLMAADTFASPEVGEAGGIPLEEGGDAAPGIAFDTLAM